MLQAAAIGVASSALLAGCGGGSRSPALTSLPLVHGAHVVTEVRLCDKGSRPYCALQFVVADPRYSSARTLVLAEQNLLHRHKWTEASPQTSDELAAESPGHKLRITYASAYGDLKGVVLGWIGRTDQVQRSLSQQMLAGSPAMSGQLQIGSQ